MSQGAVIFLYTGDANSVQKTQRRFLYVAVKRRTFPFFSESMSSLEALSEFKIELDLVYNFIKDYTRLTNNGKTIVLCWIPVMWIFVANAAAKSALSLFITTMKLPARELIPCVCKFCLAEWHDIWDCCEGNKFHSIYATVGAVIHNKNISCHDATITNRLRIGHCRITHYLLSKHVILAPDFH